MKDYDVKRHLQNDILSKSLKIHNDENRHTTYTIYKTAKLEWSNKVENFELVGLTNDLFMPDANHFCTGVSFFHRK